MYPPALGWPPFALRRITLVRWRHCLSRLEFQEFSREIPQWSDRGMPWAQSLYSRRPRARPVDRCIASLHGPPRGCEPVDQKPNSTVTIGAVRFGNDLPVSLIAGPCALESKAHALEMASALKEIAARAGIGFVYKTSFDKANRTSARSARGLGLDQALPIFSEIRDKLKVPVLTDVHEAEQCARVAPAVDVLQIPAFLCRQTDLLTAAAKTGK